jgi:hypothetical protein
MRGTAKYVSTAILAGLMWTSGAMADKAGAVRVDSGGVSAGDFSALDARAQDYSLRIIWAAKGSGAYLADVDVTIVSLPERKLVLEHTTTGPLMLADLPPGHYEVSGAYDDVLPGAPGVVKRTVVVPRQGLAQAVMYFDSGDNVAHNVAQ